MLCFCGMNFTNPPVSVFGSPLAVSSFCDVHRYFFFLSFYLSVRFTQKCENMQLEKSHAIVRALPLLNRLQYVCGQSHQLFIWHQTERGERENLLLFFSFLLFSPSHVQTGYAIVRIQLHALQSNTKVNLSPHTYAQ